MFAINVTGLVRLGISGHYADATKAVVARIADMLNKEAASKVFVEGDQVRYVNSWLRFTNRYSVLAASGSGTFDVASETGEIIVRFSISHLRQLAILAIAGAVILFLHGSNDGRFWNGTKPEVLPILLIGFYVVSYVTTWLRMTFWLKRGLAGVNKNALRPE